MSLTFFFNNKTLQAPFKKTGAHVIAFFQKHNDPLSLIAYTALILITRNSVFT